MMPSAAASGESEPSRSTLATRSSAMRAPARAVASSCATRQKSLSAGAARCSPRSLTSRSSVLRAPSGQSQRCEALVVDELVEDQARERRFALDRYQWTAVAIDELEHDCDVGRP